MEPSRKNLNSPWEKSVVGWAPRDSGSAVPSIVTGESIISLTEFKSEALLARIRESGEAIALTQNGTATAVVHNIASFRKLEQGLLMLKLLAPGKADIRRNRVLEQRGVFNCLRKQLERGSGRKRHART